MSDIDRVFAASRASSTSPSSRRQLLTIPGRGTRGTRVVEVVHLQPHAQAHEERQPRPAASIGGAAWGSEITGRAAPVGPSFEQPAVIKAAEPVVYVRPAWEPKPVEVQRLHEAEPEEGDATPTRKVRKPRTIPSSRRVADPFDANDDSANCIRCGYVVETAREKRGLMTCAMCG